MRDWDSQVDLVEDQYIRLRCGSNVIWKEKHSLVVGAAAVPVVPPRAYNLGNGSTSITVRRSGHVHIVNMMIGI